jgi:DNA-binding beta-propeller fold protein YncE
MAAIILGAMVAPTAADAISPASAATTFAPTYVRTIGGVGQATLYPSGLDVDSAGDVYVADTGNDRVEKYHSGSSTLLWSVGVRGEPIGNGTDSFESPRDVATDGTNVYVADTDDGIVQVLKASNGSYVRSIKTFGSGHKFNDPIGISVGNLPHVGEVILVSDGLSGNVYVFDPAFNLVLTVPPTISSEGTRDATTDSAGDIFTADYRGGTIDKHDSHGNLLSRWGGPNAPRCQQVPMPYGVKFDPATGNIYVASSDLEEIKVFDTSGNCVDVGSTRANVIGTPARSESTPDAFFQLRRVAVGGPDHLVYGADLWGVKILAYHQDGTSAASAQPELGDGQYPPAGKLNAVHDVAVDPSNGYLFAMDTVNQRLDRYDLPTGSNPVDFGTKGTDPGVPEFNWAQGVAYDPASDTVWVANTRNNRLNEYSPTGALELTFPDSARLQTPFNWPMGLTFDPAGNLYLADTYHKRIVSYRVSGNTLTLRWSEGAYGSGVGRFNLPWSVAYDQTQNRLLVADTLNDRIVSLNPSTGAWNGALPITPGQDPGKVSMPKGVAVDASGDVWVADTGNNRIEEFTSTGNFTGQVLGGYGTNNASFNAPQGLTFDRTGLLYVADSDNSRIQVFQPRAP